MVGRALLPNGDKHTGGLMGIGLILQIARDMDPDRVAVGRRADGMSVSGLARTVAGGASVLADRAARTLAFIGTNGPAWPVSIFAAAHAGIPVAPLNYRLGKTQLADLIGRLEEPLIVADDDQIPFVAGGGRTFLSTAEWLHQAKCAPPARPAWVEDDQAAVLLFTSGTTAAPKCVVLRHEHLTAYVFNSVEAGSAGLEEAALVSVPPYHVAGTGTVLTNLYAGRRQVALQSFAPREWLELVCAEGITSAMLVPTMLARIVDYLGADPADAPSLRSLAYGGARMPQAVLERALRAFPSVDFVNAYGLTETSSTVAVLGPADHREALTSDDHLVRARLSSVGQLVPGVEAEIRDESGLVLPPASVGELWLRGRQVSGEYVGIGSVLDRSGWFPTRDRGYFDVQGFLFIEGRSDDTIIRGGENIAPAEIEDVLGRHPDVAEVAVLGLPDEEWGERIVAVVVPRSGTQPDPDDLLAHVREHLRGSKTPNEVVYLSALPTTDTGKLLRRQLVEQLTSGLTGHGSAEPGLRPGAG
jgi:acyl-CoA synthetase (AMP-forming)/AMP-acid ligase II